MAILLFEDNVATRQFRFTSDPKLINLRKGYPLKDLVESNYPIGSTRDPETGEITPYTPPALTPAEQAATLCLPASVFWIALQMRLVDTAVLTPSDDVQAHVLAAIDAGVSAGALAALEAMTARTLVRTAVAFHRKDPDRPGLLDRIGALLGLAPEAIDSLFIEAAAPEGLEEQPE